ncbi:MAG: uroporphyrinogen-III synthase [Gallionella sp.]|nr:uroporphyrinogen-III synthase [Gallionella sp.]MDD4945563.1 uroporphyrinogen-III synthase [Gallionella sp.]MDD5612987.1 uroporphyrinogen-III synthase [Gallionella sp.]
MSAENLPLSGLKVLVTRPRDQAMPLAQAIASAGGVPLLFPLLDIAPAQDQQALQRQMAHLPGCDLAIFISPNAVSYGMAAIESAGGLPAGVKVATVGQGSAKALRAAGVAQVIAPTERFDSEGLLALPELQQIAGWRVMIFRGDGGRELLGDTLKSRGAAVEYVTCYRRSKPQQSAADLLAMLPDALTVTSSEALGYLWAMLDASAQHAMCDTPLFVPHPRIAALADAQGWRQVHQTGAGDEGLLAALKDWARARGDA